jgi:cytidyltransferase-like protein
MYNMKIIVCTGGFDPVHAGHINYLKHARSLGDKLIVGLNSDEWLVRKKGQAFMPFEHRAAVLSAIKYVDEVVAFDDSDDTACKLLEELKTSYSYAEIIFANGGDRTAANIPETRIKDVMFKFGIGGDNKQGSSSEFLQRWKPRTHD